MAKDEPAPDRLADLSPGQDGRGALVQLLARGPQNVFLDEIPQMTFWRLQYSRHTNFAVDTVERVFPLGLRFGKTARVDLPRGGDMMGDLWVELRLPALTDPDGSPHAGAWQPRVGRVLLRRAKLVINDTTVHDHERLWYDLTDRLALRAGHVAGRNEMLGTGLSMAVEHTILVPLKFFDRHTYFPVVLVPNSRVKVELDLEAFEACVPSLRLVAPPATLDLRLVADRIVLDADERNVMLLAPTTTMMYESAQDMDAVNYVVGSDGLPTGTTTASVDLSELNLPVKALVWVLYPESMPAMFEYVDLVDRATLLFGSLERMTATGDTYSKLQVWARAKRAEQGGNVHMYSFALNACEFEPSGTADFSSIQKPRLRLDLKPGAAGMKLKCKVWGLTYNWLRFQGGKVSRVFST